MTVKVTTLGKSDLGYAMMVDVNYTCPRCHENVSDTVGLSTEELGSSVVLCDCECPNCGKYLDLDIDL